MTFLDRIATHNGEGFWYLGSPYSKYPAGLEAAFVDVSCIAARLIERGVPVYSPIAYTHPVAIHGSLDALDHSLWLPLDEHMMRAAKGLIVARMEGWESSYGLAHEIRHFEAAGKPIVHLDPASLEC